jgi:hypothetical protein
MTPFAPQQQGSVQAGHGLWVLSQRQAKARRAAPRKNTSKWQKIFGFGVGNTDG